MVRNEVLRRKLTHLDGYLSELEAYREVDLEAYVRTAGPDGPSSGSSNEGEG